MSSVENFLNVLSQQANVNQANGKTTFKEKTRTLEKISLNYQGNYGRYQIFPLMDPVIDYPFIQLFDTKEICIPRKVTGPDGNETVINSWIRLLPKEAYKMKDMTGRVVSSLTKEEEDLLEAARKLFNDLYFEDGIDAKNNQEIARELMRRRNYTVFYGYCLNKWVLNNSRTPDRSNFSGLFVTTAKGFCEAVNANITEKTLLEGGDASFVEKIYNNKTSDREGFLLFTIDRSKTSAGYVVTANHQAGNKMPVTIPDDDMTLFRKSLVETFLGWQANKEDDSVKPEERRLFNANLIRDAISFMSKQLQAIRLAKTNGEDLAEAIKKTNELVLNGGEQPNATLDPMLGTVPSDGGVDLSKNTDPYKNPAASHLDPITSNPVGSNESTSPFPGFGGANFGSFGSNSEAGNDDLPF